MEGPGSQNSFAKSAGEMNIPNQMDNKDYGKKVKAHAKKIVVRSSGDPSKMYGARAIMTKESFSQYLLTEAENDITLLPDAVLGEIKSNIRTGAKDLEQKWKNALELVHKAYQVTNIRRPLPDEKGAWRQYEEMIRYGVRQLSATRGIDGEWRMASVLIREGREMANDAPQPMSKRRFFVEVPGEVATEILGTDMGEIIEQLSNKFKRHSASVRVEERNKYGAKLSVWKKGVQVDELVIKELS